MKVQVIFYSMYGHVYRMAEAVAAGAREVPGAEVALYQVPEVVPEEALIKSGAKKARDAFAHVPFAEVDRLCLGISASSPPQAMQRGSRSGCKGRSKIVARGGAKT